MTHQQAASGKSLLKIKKIYIQMHPLNDLLCFMLTLKIVKITYWLASSNATCALTYCQVTCQHLQCARGPHTTQNEPPPL